MLKIFRTFREGSCNFIAHLSVCFVGCAEAKQDDELLSSRDNVLLTDDALDETVGALDDPHVGHYVVLEVAVSAQAARQQRRRRGGHCSIVMTMSLTNQKSVLVIMDQSEDSVSNG